MSEVEGASFAVAGTNACNCSIAGCNQENPAFQWILDLYMPIFCRFVYSLNATRLVLISSRKTFLRLIKKELDLYHTTFFCIAIMGIVSWCLITDATSCGEAMDMCRLLWKLKLNVLFCFTLMVHDLCRGILDWKNFQRLWSFSSMYCTLDFILVLWNMLVM